MIINEKVNYVYHELWHASAYFARAISFGLNLLFCFFKFLQTFELGVGSAQGAFLIHANHELAALAADQVPAGHHVDISLLCEADDAGAIVSVNDIIVLNFLLLRPLHGFVELGILLLHLLLN